MADKEGLEKYVFGDSKIGMAFVTFPRINNLSFLVDCEGVYDPHLNFSTFSLSARPYGRMIRFHGKILKNNSSSMYYSSDSDCVHSNGSWIRSADGLVVI